MVRLHSTLVTIMATALGAMLMLPISEAEAVPLLQLDIVGGTYDDPTESIVISAPTATVVALGTASGATSQDDLLGKTTYLSVAAVFDNGGDVEISELWGTSIVIDGVTFDETDFVIGAPPATSDDKFIGGHGVYDTAFLEIAFNFAADAETATYNSEDNPGASTLYNGGQGSFFQAFEVGIQALASGIKLHFDLYTTKETNEETERDLFAPFSHDAEMRPGSSVVVTEIPEPGSLIIFGLALLVIGVSRKRFVRVRS